MSNGTVFQGLSNDGVCSLRSNWSPCLSYFHHFLQENTSSHHLRLFKASPNFVFLQYYDFVSAVTSSE